MFRKSYFCLSKAFINKARKHFIYSAAMLFCIAIFGCIPETGDNNSAQKVTIFLIAGQSNANGEGNAAKLPADLLEGQERVIFYTMPFEVRKGSVRCTALKPYDKNAHGLYFGPEISFGQELSKAFPNDQIAIVKFAWPGTSLYSWDKNWTLKGARLTQNEKHPNCYMEFFYTINSALEDLKAKGWEYEFAAMLWVHGEQDSKFELSAKNYEKKLDQLILNIREDLKQTKLPFICSITNPKPARFRYKKIVQKAQRELPKRVNNAAVVHTQDLPMTEDQVHFNSEGQLELGRRFAAVYLELLKSTMRN